MPDKIIQRNPDSLIAAEYNPRKITGDEFQQIADSVKRFGFVDPIIVNANKSRKDIVVGGHQRLKVARHLGLKKIPTVEVDLTVDEEKELNVRLNKNSGDWDQDLLAEHFDKGDLLDWGFGDYELLDDEWQSDIESIEKIEGSLEGIEGKVTVHFKDASDRQRIVECIKPLLEENEIDGLRIT